jgi:hypothetical protein
VGHFADLVMSLRRIIVSAKDSHIRNSHARTGV